MKRKDKINYYLDICEQIAKRSTCLRRAYACIIVNNDEIIATGYNGAPRGCTNCSDLGVCKREELNIPQGERYELCCAVHAEANAIISAARKDMLNSTLYLVGLDSKSGKVLEHTESCLMCKRLIINAGITTVIMRNGKEYKVEEVSVWKLLGKI